MESPVLGDGYAGFGERHGETGRWQRRNRAPCRLNALVNRFQFVADHQRRYGVKRLCTILGIARSSFYYWRKTAANRAARQAADAKLAARIRKGHRDSDGTYGVPRITAELREDGERVNHKRIARVMRQAGLAGLRLRRKHRTTVADPAAAKAPDLIGRNFATDTVNSKYVGDITWLPLYGGKFLYLATVIDLASRRLVGWALTDHMRTGLVIDALAAAERTRGSLAGAVIHTDHGAQYTSAAFAAARAAHRLPGRPACRPRRAPQTPNPGPARRRPHPPVETPRHRGSLRRRHPGHHVQATLQMGRERTHPQDRPRPLHRHTLVTNSLAVT
nr:IS3 family transposase [Streptomyces sp. NWU339]